MESKEQRYNRLLQAEHIHREEQELVDRYLSDYEERIKRLDVT